MAEWGRASLPEVAQLKASVDDQGPDPHLATTSARPGLVSPFVEEGVVL